MCLSVGHTSADCPSGGRPVVCSLCRRLGHSHKQLDPFIRAVQKIFPYDAGYFHDRMQLRAELSDMQKEKEKEENQKLHR